jgi:hypothetical protein
MACAVINDRLVQVGEIVESLAVERIEPDAVLLRHSGKCCACPSPKKPPACGCPSDMPAFAINAIDRAGARRFFREDAASEAELRLQLRAKSLWPVRIRRSRGTKLARLVLPAPEFIGLLHQWSCSFAPA